METETLRRKQAFASHTPETRKDIPPVSQPVQNLDSAPIFQLLRKPQTSFIKPLIPGQPGPNAPFCLECRYCKKSGHILANCRKLAYKNAQPTSFNYASQSRLVNDENNSGNAPRVPKQIGVNRDKHRTPVSEHSRKEPRYESREPLNTEFFEKNASIIIANLDSDSWADADSVTLSSPDLLHACNFIMNSRSI